MYFNICRKGFERAYDLVSGGTSRTGCQVIMVFVTDGKDTDGEAVRCGPGKTKGHVTSIVTISIFWPNVVEFASS